MIRKVKKRMIARREKKTSASPISWVGRRNWNFVNGVSLARNRQPVDDESGSFVSLLEISSSPRNKYYSNYKKSLKSKRTMHNRMRIICRLQLHKDGLYRNIIT